MRIKFLIFFIFSMFAFYSCAQNETQKQPENANEGTEFEEDGFVFSKELYKFGSITNKSAKELKVKVYSYAYGFFEKPCDTVYEITVKRGENAELKHYSASGEITGNTVLVDINGWKGAGWFCSENELECSHDVDGIWSVSVGNSYSDYVRDENTGELIPFALDEIQFTVNEDDSIQIKVIPVNE